MKNPPPPQCQPLLGMKDIVRSLILGIGMGGILMLFDIWLLWRGMGFAEMRAVVFTAMVCLNMGLVIYFRQAYLLRHFSSIGWWTLGLTMLSLGIVVCVPAVAELFSFQPLPFFIWVMTAVVFLLPFPFYRMIRR